MAPSKVTDDYYKILKVEQNASTATITQSYKRLALKTHPDRNSRHDATEAFQLLSRAYETLKDENRRRHYDLHDYPNIKSTQSFPRGPEVVNDTVRIAQLRKSKQERTTTWRNKKNILDSAILEAQRGVRRIEQQIKNLDTITAAERAEEAQKNSWGTWLLSPFHRKVEESEEEKDHKDRERQERKIERDMKERRLVSAKSRLKNDEDLLANLQRQYDNAMASDDEKIRVIEARIAEAERLRQLEIWRRQQDELAKQQRKAAEELRKRKAEEERAREKRQQEALEALRKRQAEQRATEEQRRQEAERYKREVEQRRRADSVFEDYRHFSNGGPYRENRSSCIHHGWWAKKQGRTQCPECGDVWNYLLQCPGCKMQACPRYQADIRPPYRSRRARVPPSDYRDEWNNWFD